MKNRVLNTEEICRITYDDGDFERLMKQTYTNDAPFYTIQKGACNLTPVETSSHNINEIIAHLEKCNSIDKEHYSTTKFSAKVLEIANGVISKQEQFIGMIKEYAVGKMAQKVN